MKVWKVNISRDDEERTGMKPGTYVVHQSESAATIQFRPQGDWSFWIGKAMEEEE